MKMCSLPAPRPAARSNTGNPALTRRAASAARSIAMDVNRGPPDGQGTLSRRAYVLLQMHRGRRRVASGGFALVGAGLQQLADRHHGDGTGDGAGIVEPAVRRHVILEHRVADDGLAADP